MSVTPQAIHFHLEQLADTEKYLIAYSGGVDSHVLLHLCSQLKNSPSGFEQSFSAVYIDHGLSYHSKKWGKHCQHICFELDIPLTIVEVDARPAKGQSPEASARIARYRAFSQLLDKNECLLTAQHLDDQAETLLLQLLRGSGSKGLSAMPRVKSFTNGLLCRPMLDYKKQDIQAYARQHQLQWIEDESNQEDRYDRNYLRHTILPLLAKRWPAVQENFARSAELLAGSQALMDEMADDDIHAMYYINENGVVEYDKLLLKPVLELLKKAQKEQKKIPFHCQHREQARLKNLLRHWISLNQQPLPSKKILEQIVCSVVQAREDAVPVVRWKRDAFHCEIRRYRDKLYLLDVSNNVSQSELQSEHHTRNQQEARLYTLIENQVLEISQNNSLIKLVPANEMAGQQGFNRQILLSKEITVGFRKGGERFRKTANGKTQQLKHWFQEQGIPPWERTQLPLIYWGEELLQVGNYLVNHSLQGDSSDNSLIIHWISQDLDEITDQKR